MLRNDSSSNYNSVLYSFFYAVKTPTSFPYLNILLCKIRKEKSRSRRCEKGTDYTQVAWLTLCIKYFICTHDYWQLVKLHHWPHYSQLKPLGVEILYAGCFRESLLRTAAKMDQLFPELRMDKNMFHYKIFRTISSSFHLAGT